MAGYNLRRRRATRRKKKAAAGSRRAARARVVFIETLSPARRGAIARARNRLEKAPSPRGPRTLLAYERAVESYRAVLANAGLPPRQIASLLAAATRSRNLASLAKTKAKAKHAKKKALPKKPKKERLPKKEPKKPSKPSVSGRRPSTRAPKKKVAPAASGAVDRARLRLELTPRPRTERQRVAYEDAVRSYREALATLGYSPAQIRAFVGWVSRRRVERYGSLAEARRIALGMPLDASIPDQWTELRAHVGERSRAFRRYLAYAEDVGIDEDTAIDLWFSPEGE